MKINLLDKNRQYLLKPLTDDCFDLYFGYNSSDNTYLNLNLTLAWVVVQVCVMLNYDLWDK